MTLLPRFKKLPVKRVVALNNITGDTRLSVSYDDAGTGLMPAGTPSAEIAAFLISGMEDVAAKYNATGKVNFRLFPFYNWVRVAVCDSDGFNAEPHGSSNEPQVSPPGGFPSAFNRGCRIEPSVETLSRVCLNTRKVRGVPKGYSAWCEAGSGIHVEH